MEKSKRKRILWGVLKALLAILVVAGTCALSVWAGICTVVFTGVGYFLGYNNRANKLLDSFLTQLIEHKDDVLAGKVINIEVDEETGRITVRTVEEAKENKKTSKK